MSTAARFLLGLGELLSDDDDDDDDEDEDEELGSGDRRFGVILTGSRANSDPMR